MFRSLFRIAQLVILWIAPWLTRRIALLLILVVGMVLFQSHVLEVQPEKQTEMESSDLSKLPATSMVPQYVGSLFMGVLRALAVDLLWLDYFQAKDNYEYFKAVQIMEMLTSLQPRNEEIWAFLGWDAAYNVAGNLDKHEDKWHWIRYGIGKFLEGSQINNRTPTLKYELAHWMGLRASNEKPYVPMDEFILPFMRDKDLQERLMGRRDAEATPFEAAIEWYRRARDQLWKQFPSSDPSVLPYYYSSTGKLIDTWGIDTFIREMIYTQIILEWQYFNDLPRAKKTLDRAIDHMNTCKALHRSRTTDCVQFAETFTRLKTALTSLETMAVHNTVEQKYKVLDDLEAVFRDSYFNDDLYIQTWLSRFKIELGGDPYEYNDHILNPFPIPGKAVNKATIGPLRSDLDRYQLSLTEREAKSLPRPVRFSIQIDPGLALNVEIRSGRLVAQREFSGGIHTLDVTLNAGEDQLIFWIKHPGGSAPWSPSATYSFRLEVP